MSISLAINLTLSGSRLSKRTFLRATMRPETVSLARYTLLYVPDPILRVNRRTKPTQERNGESVRYTPRSTTRFQGSAYLIELLEGVGAARRPAAEGLPRDSDEPRRPAGGELLRRGGRGDAPLPGPRRPAAPEPPPRPPVPVCGGDCGGRPRFGLRGRPLLAPLLPRRRRGRRGRPAEDAAHSRWRTSNLPYLLEPSRSI